MIRIRNPKSKIEIEMGKGGVGCNIFRALNKCAPPFGEQQKDFIPSVAADEQTINIILFYLSVCR